MQSKVRRNLGDPIGSNLNRYSTDLIKDTLNEAYLYYALLMMNSGQGDFAQAPETINIVANQYIYDLSTLMTFTPLKVSLVERSYSSNWTVLDKWQKTTGSFYTTGVGSGVWFPSYRFLGTSLIFNQMPNFSQTAGLRVEAYKVPTELSADSDQPAGVFSAAYHNLLVLSSTVACIHAKEATGVAGDPDKFIRRLEKMEEAFLESISTKSDSREYADPFVTEDEGI